MTPFNRPPRSNAKDDLVNIIPSKQNRNTNAGELRNIVAVDTETQDGYIFLIADSEGNWFDGKNITFEIHFNKRQCPGDT